MNCVDIVVCLLAVLRRTLKFEFALVLPGVDKETIVDISGPVTQPGEDENKNADQNDQKNKKVVIDVGHVGELLCGVKEKYHTNIY